MWKNKKAIILFFKEIIYWGPVGFYIYFIFQRLNLFFGSYLIPDRIYLKRRFLHFQGYPLDLKNPQTLNEKLQWLKLHDRRDLHPDYADKFKVRDYISRNFGQDLLIPLLFETTDYRKIKPENLPEPPYILKASHDSGSNYIVRDATRVDWKRLRTDCHWWLLRKYAYQGREWWYSFVKPRIVVEQLLETTDKGIPNDYKLNCINGKVEFIYVSIDREGSNKRNIYDRNWKPLYFTWAHPKKDAANLRGKEILAPVSLHRMISIAEEIAKQFPYVRVDFYEVEGRLYFGEITQCHGGGFDQMRPIEWDYKWGQMLDLNFVKFK
jgi:hypothetical protein